MCFKRLDTLHLTFHLFHIEICHGELLITASVCDLVALGALARFINLHFAILCRYFYATLHLGTPARQFAVIVDTGSTITYVPCASCGRNCGPHHKASPPDITAPHCLPTSQLSIVRSQQFWCLPQIVCSVTPDAARASPACCTTGKGWSQARQAAGRDSGNRVRRLNCDLPVAGRCV